MVLARLQPARAALRGRQRQDRRGHRRGARRVEAELPRPGVEFAALLPYERGDLIDRLHQQGEIDLVEHTADGTRVSGRANDDLAGELAAYAV